MERISNRLYTAGQVRQLDAAAIDGQGIPGYELMNRAGGAVFRHARHTWPDAGHWVILCGGGNNGGDGYVVARLALEAGLQVSLLALKAVDELGGDAARAAADWQAAGGEIGAWPEDRPAEAALVVDALLGTGLDREVQGAYRDAIAWANELKCPRVAIDIPSGLGADTGRVMGVALAADLTVTFIGLKCGLFTADGPDCRGDVVFDALEVPPEVYGAVDDYGCLLDREILRRRLRRRARNSHKGTFGHVAVVGGDSGMSGAARLAAEAALRTGAGLVSVATHPDHAALLNLSRPELMVQGVRGPGDLEAMLERATVLAVGPGLGQGEWGRGLLGRCLDAGRPTVVDADGLNLLAGKPRRREAWVLTPHPAEAARLLGVSTAEVQADRIQAVLKVADRYSAVVILKGCGTVVASPAGEWCVCPLGNPGMATAGTGDVLTGVVAGMLAQGHEPWLAARLATAAHAAAGDEAARGGERGLLASDLVACLRDVLNA